MSATIGSTKLPYLTAWYQQVVQKSLLKFSVIGSVSNLITFFIFSIFTLAFGTLLAINFNFYAHQKIFNSCNTAWIRILNCFYDNDITFALYFIFFLESDKNILTPVKSISVFGIAVFKINYL